MGELGTNFQLSVVEPAKTLALQIGQFFILILWAIIILLVGWIIAKVIKSLVTKLLKTCKVDELSERIDLDDVLAKGGIPYTFSELMGIVFYWLTLLVTIVVAINAVGLTVAADLLSRVILYIPNIIAAVFILIFGMFIATLLRNIVQTAATNAGINEAKLLAKIVEVCIVVFTVMIALEQLGIAPRIIELVVGIVLGSLGLAFAIAFGFGCQEQAREFLVNLIEKLKTKK
ncbi:MAG: hypothetical protein N2606_01030 [Candidatus Omnitrophica bacterium]|nr:hypothetical protein [Candidatus Omnitrophota bacterium]